MHDTIILNKMMKTNHIFGILITLCLILVFGLAITNFNQPVVLAQNTDATPALQQGAPAPILQDQSEIGSTDGILVMGIVIVGIIITPLLFHKKNI